MAGKLGIVKAWKTLPLEGKTYDMVLKQHPIVLMWLLKMGGLMETKSAL